MGDRVDRNGLEVLTEEECWRFLDAHHIGRLAVSVANEPEIFPVNYVVHDGCILFLTAEGTKLAGAILGTGVVFEIDAADPLFHTGWSVIIHGHAEEVDTMDDLAVVEDLPLQPWGPGAKHRYVRIRPASVTGRRIATPGAAGVIAEH